MNPKTPYSYKKSLNIMKKQLLIWMTPVAYLVVTNKIIIDELILGDAVVFWHVLSVRVLYLNSGIIVRYSMNEITIFNSYKNNPCHIALNQSTFGKFHAEWIDFL